MTAESLNYARQYLRKARHYLDSGPGQPRSRAPDPAAGDATHAGISPKDAAVTALTGATSKSKDHAKAAGELRQALSGRPDPATAERALRELIAAKGDVEYGTKVPTAVQATSLVRRARTLVELAEEIIDGH